MKEFIVPIQITEGRSIIMEIPPALIPDWCLQLILLREALVPSIVIGNSKRDLSLEISVLSKGRYSSLVFYEHSVKMDIAKNELDYCVKFFLKTYRDDISDGDHLDIEYITKGTNAFSGYLTT